MMGALLAAATLMVCIANPQSTNQNPSGVSLGDVYPPNGSTGANLSHSSSNGAYYVTRMDGQFSCAWYWVNKNTPGFPTNYDYDCVSINSDGQLNQETWHWNGSSYILSSRLRLDQNTEIGLAAGTGSGGNGGGIATDQNTSQTCIPAALTASCSIVTAERWTNTGFAVSYLGQATAGNGRAIPIYSNVNASVGLPLGATTLFTTPPASGNTATTYGSAPQLYFAKGWIRVTGGSPTAGATCTPSFTVTDGGSSRTVTAAVSPAASNCGAVGNVISYQASWVSDVNTAVQISVSASAGTPTVNSSLKITIE